ncbi:hypothetical protein PNOK_0538500 [Pyrrhoderma noxium]|uniref:Uncharacterized protein n=1 Tax=Pyrrhoderma noxium TaxID=2282107 RepID=A0A286UG24_9AGAM|nr:hypothetical protein PNOK_0538500 [Pyrrhoderma noxium]
MFILKFFKRDPSLQVSTDYDLDLRGGGMCGLGLGINKLGQFYYHGQSDHGKFPGPQQEPFGALLCHMR